MTTQNKRISPLDTLKSGIVSIARNILALTDDNMNEAESVGEENTSIRTAEDVNLTLRQFKKEHEDKRNALLLEYAIATSPYKMGDVIESKIDRGRITGFRLAEILSEYGTTPKCIYLCDKLTKKGTVNRKTPTTEIWWRNVIKKIS